MNTTARIKELLDSNDGQLYRKVMGEVEKELINTVLVHCHGNITKSARVLGVYRTTVKDKYEQYKGR